MKTFISIDIPENQYRTIRDIQEQLPEFIGKKTELENLHLTLKFLGHIGKEEVDEVRETLKKVEYKRFETEFKYIGFFDNQKYGVVWIHLNNCEPLQREIDGCLEKRLGIERERRFMAHLTIARVKYTQDRDKFVDELSKIRIPETKFSVDNFRLKESTTRENKPYYETLCEYGLN